MRLYNHKKSIWGAGLLITTSLFALILSVPASKATTADPWASLDGFAPVPDSTAQIAENYIATLYQNAQKHLIAVVIFNARCDSTNCTVKRGAAYAIFDADGVNATLYVDPRDEKELERLIPEQGPVGLMVLKNPISSLGKKAPDAAIIVACLRPANGRWAFFSEASRSRRVSYPGRSIWPGSTKGKGVAPL